MTKKDSTMFLPTIRIFLGLIFLSAGLYRIFHFQEAIQEVASLRLGPAILLAITTIIIEVIGGISLMFNFQTKKVLAILAVSLSCILFWTLFQFWPELLASASLLFTFHINSTDLFLHITYVIIIIYLLLESTHNHQTEKKDR